MAKTDSGNEERGSKRRGGAAFLSASSSPCMRANESRQRCLAVCPREPVHARTRLHTRPLATTSYKSDSQDGIAQTSRHDTRLRARNSLSRWLACAICVRLSSSHSRRVVGCWLSPRPAVIRRRAFACPTSELDFTRVTPFRNSRAAAPHRKELFPAAGPRTRSSSSRTQRSTDPTN